MEKRYKLNKSKITDVIIVELTKGKGTENDPVRGVYQFWSRAGNFIAEKNVNDFPLERF